MTLRVTVILFLAIGASWAGPSMHDPFYCYTTDPIRSTTIMHCQVTSYEAIRRFNFTTVDSFRSTCTPARFWYLGRYGGRYPTERGMENMMGIVSSTLQADIVRNYGEGRTTLCRQDFEGIRDWTVPPGFVPFNQSRSTDESILTMKNIARRFQQVFPNILTETYSPDRFHFRHTDAERTNTSARAFATGLFGEAAAQSVIYEDVPEVDWLLRPFDFCPLFSEDSDPYLSAFENGPEIAALMRQVNAKLGLHDNPLSFYYIVDIWNWCRFETASNFFRSGSETGPHSSWCAAFSVANHELMEYWEDMDYFYYSGYGAKNQHFLVNMHCGLIQDLLHHVQSDSGASARIFITNINELQGMLTVLGAFRDPWPIHQHNFAQQFNRFWKTSVISSFGANLAVVRYDCYDGDDELIFLLNERLIRISGCDLDTGICKLSTIVDRFQRFLNANCEQLFCSMD